MSTTVPLPSALQARLAGVARRVRRMHVLRGASILILALATLAGLAFLTDYLLREALPGVVRSALLVSWVGLGVLLVRGLARRLFQPLDAADLAAVIETKYPELGERLTSSVELCQNSGAGNGSPALIALLVQETEARTGQLDLAAAVSGRSTRLLAGLAAVALLTMLAPAAVAPARYGRLASRFFLPWHTLAPLPDYAFAVEPGDTHAARGRPLTVSAVLSPRDDLPLPRKATLVVIAADGATTRHDMAPDTKESTRFAVAFRLGGDSTYRVEAGNAKSLDHAVTAVTPVDLAPDSPSVIVTPPAYASSVIDEETFTGMADLGCLQHSDVTFRFRFTRPAVAATLEWTASGEKTTAFPLKLTEEGQAAEFHLAATKSGTYRVLLDAEHGIRTDRDGGAIAVRADQPPALLKFAGKDGVRAARPYDRLPLEARLADDIAVAGAQVEYRVNDGKPLTEPMQLEGARDAAAKHVFLLAGKVKPGDELHYRLRYLDNLPKEYGGPHVCYHPADGWLKLRIVAEGGSLREQEILAHRDAVNQRLDQIKADLKREQRKIMNVRAESRREDVLSDKHRESLAGAKQQNQQTEKALRDLAREAAEKPGGQKLAEMARDVAQQEMREAEQGLQDATERGAKPRNRDERLANSEDELSNALTKIERMRAANEQLAKEKLDQAKVEALADRQQELAKQAEELAQKDATKEPEAEKLAEQLKREQDQVAKELEQLTQSSPALKKALEEARAEQARQAADKARELAQAQRDLAKASEETERRREAEKLAELANQQESLAKKAEQLAKDTEKPARANFAQPLQPRDAAKAAESLKKGDGEKAAREQDQAARELDRLARDLERGAELAKDPKTAARQLGRIEGDLAKKLREGQVWPNEEAAREQKAIREAAEKLSVPPGRRDLEAEKRKATDALAKAERALEKKEAKEALAEMEKGRQALQELANRMPSLGERTAQAKRDLAKLMRDQDDVAKRAKDPAKSAEAARKQADVAKGLEKLDTPGAESRRDKASEAAKKAQEDLAQRKKEAPASQAATKREMEKLVQSLAGQKNPDEKATELARRQRELEQKAAKADPTKTRADELRREQRALADETRDLEAREAPGSKREASDSTRKAADEAAKSGPTSKQTRQAMADAAKKLDELAKQLGGEKGDAGTALPSKEQAEAARKLAREQRELRDAVQKTADQMRAERKADSDAGKESDAGKLAREQADIAREAGRLAQSVAKEQGEKSSPAKKATEADRAADEASKGMESGALEKAQKSGSQAAEQLRQLASELSKTKRGSGSPEKGDTLEQARKLANRQDAVNKQLDPTAGDASAQRAAQQARQGELTRRAGELMRELDEVSKSAQRPAQSSAQEAARAARQAEKSMQAARNQAREGNQPGTQTQREMAARNLEQAARQADQAGKSANPSSPSQQAGRSVQEARGQMNEARDAMQQNQPGRAGESMQQAARSLGQAAERLMQAMRPAGQPATAPTNPNDQGAPSGGVADTRDLPKELAAYSGKKWGELPGEVRSRVVQQMKARYGDDYARMIKLYFEQIADTRSSRSKTPASRP